MQILKGSLKKCISFLVLSIMVALSALGQEKSMIAQGAQLEVERYTITKNNQTTEPIAYTKDTKASYTITEGDSFSLCGIVYGQSRITEITVNIYKKDTINYLTSVYPNTYMYNLSGITIDTKQLGLKAGDSYDIKIWADTELVKDASAPMVIIPLTIVNNSEVKLNQDMNALNIVYANNDTANSVTQNIGLPKTGANGSIITWTSNHPEVLNTCGIVTRPTSCNTNVTLLATLTLDGKTVTKSFCLTVIANKVQENVVGKITIKAKEKYWNVRLKFSSDLSECDKKKVKKTSIIYYDIKDNNKVILNVTRDRRVTSFTPWIDAGTYKVEVIYYDENGRKLASGSQEVTYKLDFMKTFGDNMGQGFGNILDGKVDFKEEMKKIQVYVKDQCGNWVTEEIPFEFY